LNIGFGSTNYYAVSDKGKYLLIDAGMPGTLGVMMSRLRKFGIVPQDIRHLLVTHFHPDHCGIAQELQSLGVELIISGTQRKFLDSANASLKKKFDKFVEMVVKPQNIINEDDPSAFMKKLGFPGYLLHTPGHSDDSISIVVEGAGVFTGDLPLSGRMNMEVNEKVQTSWSRLRSTNEKKVFPGHGPSMTL